MDIMETIKGQIEGNRIILYMKGTPTFPQCGFSSLACNLLNNCGAKFAHINVLEEPEIRENLRRYADWPTFPQLYISGELVGGSDIMKEMYEQGDLQKLVDVAMGENT